MKKQVTRWLGCSLSLLLALAPTISKATFISPTVDGSVRDGLEAPKDDTPDTVLDNSVVQALDVPQFEDRGIIEFSLSEFSERIANAQLVLPVFRSNGPFPFRIDVFTYTGDGALTLSDWDQGSLFASFSYSGESIVTLDVTSFIRSARAAGHAFAGFNFQFAVPSSISLNGPFVAFHSLDFPPAAFLKVNEPVGGSVSAIRPRKVDCLNLTTRQRVSIELGVVTSWDCEAAGLIVNPGDKILQTVIGRAK
jgi:hypothetical protein